MGANVDDHERLFATSFHVPNLVGGLASFARSGRELVNLPFLARWKMNIGWPPKYLNSGQDLTRMLGAVSRYAQSTI